VAASAQLRASAPGEIGQNVSWKREHAEQDTSAQARLFGTDISEQFKDDEQEEQPDPEGEQPGQREILSFH
jgi:hypothetical protein